MDKKEESDKYLESQIRNPEPASPIVSDQEKDTAIDYEKKLIQVMIYDELLGFVNRENRESMPRRMFSHFANALTDKILSIIEKERNYIEKCKSFIDKCSNEMGENDAKIQELQREIDDNRKVIASNGMTIGELRSWVEKYKTAMKQ